MSLYEQWKDLIENQSDESFTSFWEAYSGAETKIYSNILSKKDPVVEGTFGELASNYHADPVLFMGFLDGINTSLRNELAIETFDETSKIKLDIDFEKLYFNMHKAEADYLYNLDEWDSILSQTQREEIFKAFRRSKTVIKDKAPGRNDPCPCGSGKKYKKCCGATLS